MTEKQVNEIIGEDRIKQSFEEEKMFRVKVHFSKTVKTAWPGVLGLYDYDEAKTEYFRWRGLGDYRVDGTEDMIRKITLETKDGILKQEFSFDEGGEIVDVKVV